jgi:hypothetical protein
VPKVVGVEVNPIIVNDIAKGKYAGYNGDLYRNPKVTVVVDEGRSYIRRSGELYGSIQATLVDTWAASSSGAFTLSENNIYTVEAFDEFLEHLAPRGIIAVTRWYDAGAPKEFLRLLALGRAALERRGVAPAAVGRHVAIATDNDRRATLLLSRDPYSDGDVALLNAKAAEGGLRLLFTPRGTAAPAGGNEDPVLRGFIEAPSAQAALARLPYDASPTTDDRPFFFYNLRGRQLLSIFGTLGALGSLEINNLGIALLAFLLILSVVLTAVLVLGPLLLLRRAALREARVEKLRILGYFLCLGLGYILVEIGFMQKFVLFLGHPIYALAVVLATLLAASGAGSALSGWGAGRFGARGFVGRAAGGLAVLLAIYAVALTPLFHALLGLPLAVRVLVAVVLIAPPGLLMGAFLPSGVRAAAAAGPDLVAWAWSANGAASVVGSVAAVSLSMNFGFTLALAVGIAIYLLAPLLFPRRAGGSRP